MIEWQHRTCMSSGFSRASSTVTEALDGNSESTGCPARSRHQILSFAKLDGFISQQIEIGHGHPDKDLHAPKLGCDNFYILTS